MKRSKHFLLLAGMLLAMVAASGQPGGNGPQMTPEERAAKQTSRMIGEFELNAEQSTKVEEINLRYAKAHAEARDQAAGDMEAMHSSMMKLNTKLDEEFKGILSEVQFSRYEEFQTEQRKGMQGGPQGGGQGGGNPRP